MPTHARPQTLIAPDAGLAQRCRRAITGLVNVKNRLWWLALGSFAVFVAASVIRLVLAIGQVEIGRGAEVGGILIFVVSGPVAAASAIVYFTGRVLAKAAVRIGSNDAASIVFVAQRTGDLTRKLRALSKSSGVVVRTLGSFLVVVVNPEGIELWRVRDTVGPEFRIAWSRVSAIDVGDVVLSRPLPCIDIRVNHGEAGETLQFAPCRGGNLSAFAILDRGKVAALCGRMRALRA